MTAPTPPRAVLVSVHTPEVSDEEHRASLAELGRLVHTLGYQVAATVTQRRDAPAHNTVLGEGKLKELADITGGAGDVGSSAPAPQSKARDKWAARDDEPDNDENPEPEVVGDEDSAPKPEWVVVVDHEITPSQARNLEKATEAEVLDRTGVIVEIFHRHARSREARLQVEIARLTYVVPRMRESGRGRGDRQRGGVGGKGAGESALELDRRKVRDRVAELREELESVKSEQDTRRARRKDAQRVALVGYTNAGKSSLMRALTGSEVYVADKLFATLDTTVRALHPETRPRVLVSDTVGFIHKLPHDLVASFRSTLDEALEASLLLFVADASDPTFRQQLSVTREVLGEIGANEVPQRLILNKCDRLDAAAREELAQEFPDAMQLSAHAPDDVKRLREEILQFFVRGSVEEELLVPYGRQGVVGEIHARTKVLSEDYDEKGATFRVSARPETLAALRSLLASE